jgi:hypothetical protein
MNTTRENISLNIEPDNDESFDSQGSLHLSDLEENSNLNNSNNTTREEEEDIQEDSFGVKLKKRKTMKKRKKRKTMKKHKKRKTMKKRKTIKKRKTRRMKGGNVDTLGSADFNPNLAYDSKQDGGQNIGANCNDPNFSIYNTRELTLFPYRPN